MGAQPSDQERQWAAEKRDFVADARDDLADERDSASDERDRDADARESALDARERELDVRAADLGLPPLTRQEVAHRAEERADRKQERSDREDQAADRATAADARDAAAKRRLDANPTTQLAAAFATIAESLYAADSYDAVLLRIAQTAVGTVAGCDMASITLTGHRGYQTAASTDSTAMAVDQAQYDVGEGPALDAFDTPMVYAESFPDRRWPRLDSRPADLGAQSAASYRMAGATRQDDGSAASLNTYGAEPEAFTQEAQEIGLILAAHASMAAGVVRERDALRDLADNLGQALLSRDVIGQAKGILMERLKLTPEDAFDVLRRASNRLNAKLQRVAVTLAETGELDPADAEERETG